MAIYDCFNTRSINGGDNIIRQFTKDIAQKTKYMDTVFYDGNCIYPAYQKVQTFVYKDMDAQMLFITKVIVFIQLIAGMLIVVYMCDRTTKYGIGGRMSVFMINIVDGMMNMFAGQKAERLVLPVIIGVVEIAVMIVIETTEKRIAVQRVSINNIYADKNYLAYKLNPVGAMPLMFTSAVFMLPQFVCSGLYYLHPHDQRLAWLVENLRLTAALGNYSLSGDHCNTYYFIFIGNADTGQGSREPVEIRGFYSGYICRKADQQISRRYSDQIFYLQFDNHMYMSGSTLFLQFGGYIDSTLAMLPCSIMMSTGIWISLYREAEVYRNMDRYHPFI